MIRVRAHSRLHFGLLNPGPGESWPNIDGDAVLTGRRFGGVGLMIEEPSLILTTKPAAAWSATGPMARRALEFAQHFVGGLDTPGPGGMLPMALSIKTAPPEHAGFGSGTQVGLAVAGALAAAAGHEDWDAVELARRVGRGLRSAVGIHGFQHGGLIVEAGKRGEEPVAPLIACKSLPVEWRIVVILPDVTPGAHGAVERAAFEQLGGKPSVTESLSRLVLLGMLPALREGDCRPFGEAVYDFNARVGELFAAAQGGRYANPRCTEIVTFVRGLGVTGVGQSSWGPTLFAIVEEPDRAESIANRLRRRFETATIWVTKPAGPAEVTTG
jgi:beta-RFAP synthase